MRAVRTFLLALLWVLHATETQALEPVSFRAGLLKVGSARSEESGKIELTALRRVLEIQGIPYRLVGELSEMRRYQTVFTAGSLLDLDTSAEVVNALYDYVERGGTLVSAGQIGKRLYPLFGIVEHRPSRGRYRLSFSRGDPALKYLNRPEEFTISLGNGPEHFFDEVIWTHGYRGSRSSNQLGSFDDGLGGFHSNRYGKGTAYLLGLTYTDAVLRPQIGKDFEAQRAFVNSFEPSADVIMLILKGIYELHTHPFVIHSAIPFAWPTALILSHDVDAQTAFVDSGKFADLEEQFGVTSTFFETTKIFRDAMDIDYYNIADNRNAISSLKARGWDIGSHSVSHAKGFGDFPIGEPNVTIGTYDPTTRKTIFGEVIVSKQLLDRDIRGQNTVSFRAGDLAFPFALIEVLEKSGYLYDSTFSANDVMSAFPYFAFRNRIVGSEESTIVEIPVTLDDALSFLTRETVDRAVATWIEVVTANMENGGITVLLVHPSDTRDEDYKLRAQKRVMQFVRERNGWMGNVTEFGEFVRERAHAQIDVYRSPDDGIVLRIGPRNARAMVGFILGNMPVDASRIRIEQEGERAGRYVVVKHGAGFRVTSKP